jgi:hypothetical protein
MTIDKIEVICKIGVHGFNGFVRYLQFYWRLKTDLVEQPF